jgi:uncharacterized protein with FMN-binding domain
MKRFLLIAAGTVGGLGAVLSVTPPQLGTTDLGLNLDAGTLTTAETPTQTPAVVQNTPATSAPTKSATKPSPVKTSSTKADASNPTTSTQTSTPAPAQNQATTPATPTPTVISVNGTFTGPVVDVSYGNVQVQITVTNGKIIDAKVLIAPTRKNDKYTKMSLPTLRQQTLAAQSTSIQGVSGASYTTYGWRKSLQGAMVKAGL